MFYRVRDDQSGYEPRKLFTMVEFIMHDKNHVGSIDLDEAVTILYQRFGKETVETAMKEISSDDGMLPPVELRTSALAATARDPSPWRAAKVSHIRSLSCARRRRLQVDELHQFRQDTGGSDQDREDDRDQDRRDDGAAG